MTPTLLSVKAAYERLGYKWNDKFNLFGIRAAEYGTNDYNDLIGFSSGELFLCFNATTDPGFAKGGTEVPEGTASLHAGFYPNMYGFGYHKGDKDHPCFRQINKATYYRKKGDRLYDPSTVFSGVIGTNIHSTSESFTPDRVDDFSRGCQVVKRWASLAQILNAARESGLTQFDYALLTENQLT